MLVNERLSAPCYRPQTLASNLAKSQIEEPPFGLNAEQLEIWRVDAIKKIQIFVGEEYDKPIDELVEYLGSIIDREAG